MGKKGDLLRAQKAQTSTYTFTREQLKAHDMAVVEDYKKRFDFRLRQEFKAEEDRVNAVIMEEWKRREQIFSDHGGNESMFTLLSMTLAVPIEVLIDEFGWRTLPDEKHKMHPRSRLARFVLRCQEILEGIATDEKQDIREYCAKVWERSGVKLQYAEEAAEQGES